MSVSLRFFHLTVICEFSIRVASFIRGGPRCSQASDDLRETSLIKETMPFDFSPMVLHLGIFEWIMPHVYHFFVSFVFLFFSFLFVFVFLLSVHSNCSEIWGLSTPNTIEQWDTSGLYSYPDQTRWISSPDIVPHSPHKPQVGMNEHRGLQGPWNNVLRYSWFRFLNVLKMASLILL